MTLTQALDHDWLALPSSQHSEAPAYPLGGDSMYEFQDFDRSCSASESFEAGEWSRPMTASGTNLESGMGLADYRAESVESDDSYSQRVKEIKLGSGSVLGQSGPEPLSHTASHVNGNGDGIAVDGSPPSPPLTAERIDVEVTSNGNKPDDEAQRPPTPSEVERNEAPGTATKRKALEVDFFASGSLSPPPPESIEVELPSPATSTHKPRTPRSEPSPAPGSRRSTRSTAKPLSTTTTTPATRGRKSMRLA
jgi:hypothetical protein